MKTPGDDLRSAIRRKPSFFRTMKTVAWSFFGVRKSVDYADDVGQLNPVHLAIAAVISALLFIGLLLLLVNWILSSGVAA